MSIRRLRPDPCLRWERHPEGLLDIPQVQLSFENRSALLREDRELLTTLGLTFQGRKAWPLCRSYRPSCPPWFLEADEIRLLHVALEQLLEMAPRFKSNQSLDQR